MKIIVAHPDKQHSFRTAEALNEKSRLLYYITTIYDKPFSLTRITKLLLKGNFKKKAASRKDPNLPDNVVLIYCEGQSLLRLLLSKFPRLYHKFPRLYDRLHDRFGRKVARIALRKHANAVIMYDSTSNECFKILKENSPQIKRILDVSIANRLWMIRNFEVDMKNTGDTGLRREMAHYWSKENQHRYLEEIKLADYFFVGSNMVAKSLEYSGVNKDKIFLARYGVDVDKFNFIKKQNPSAPLKLLFVGQVGYRKGMNHLLRVVTSFPPESVEIFLAGTYDSNEKIYKTYKNISNIHFLGFITRDILAKLYQDCHVFVFPSLGEGYAMVILEALSCGMPCIVSNLSGGDEAIIDGENGFVIPGGDDKALKEKIQWFIDNPKELPRMSEASRESAMHQTWDDYSRMVNEALDKILGDNKND